MKRTFLAFIILSLLSFSAFGQATDHPNPDEPFATFFARITRGGPFPGIYVNPPVAIQNEFLKTIRLGYWVGRRDKVAGKLKAQNIDLWNVWYREEKTFPILFNTQEKRTVFLSSLKQQLLVDQQECRPSCPEPEKILNQEWKALNPFSRQEFVRTFILELPLFAGRTLLEYLADQYDYPAENILKSTEIRLLSDSDFIKAVRELGYNGPIYFRGITAPNPNNSEGHVILINQEALAKGTPFDPPLLRTLELVGILTHELSHAFQDAKGKSLGSDVQVRSAEAVLLLEGSAEYLAEQAMTEAALQEQSPSALELFVTEQAIEIVSRPGNDRSGNLFPYTVGLPFTAALYNHQRPEAHKILTEKILRFLGGETPLNEWLARLSD